MKLSPKQNKPRKKSFSNKNIKNVINFDNKTNQQLENKIIKKCINKIQIVKLKEEKKGNKCGSLYEMFASECFDVNLLICYLDKKDEQGIIDTLVNLMYKNFINESFFYIPQLCTMITYKKYFDSLSNYILDRCVDQMKFSLKIHWLISSYIEKAEPKILKKYDKLIQRIEMTLVNGRRATMSNYKMYTSLHIISEEEVFKQSLDKEFRLNYFDKVMRFYHDLRLMCEKLKEYPKENKVNPKQTRHNVMKSYLKSFNSNIKNLNKFLTEESDTLTKSFFKGYVIPFDDSYSTMDEHCSLIVNFLPEHSFCFSTKARVPVKIAVETIRVLEVSYWDDLIIEDECMEEVVDNEESEESNRISSLTSTVNRESVMENNKYEVVSYSSIDDFFSKMEEKKPIRESISKRSTNNSTAFKKKSNTEQEIKKIMDKIIEANKTGVNIRSSNVSTIMTEPNEEEENCLYYGDADSVNPFGQKWSDIAKNIKEKSKYRNFNTYAIKTFIAKANDDLRQELMTMQLIKRFHDIFTKAEIPLKLRPYEILITSPSSGLIEFMPNTISFDALKKNLPNKWNLNTFFRNFFKNNFEEAQKNFTESLAGYCLVTYVINIKDRHNGNILLDMNGNVIHIDFGFILGISPGNLNFENAPFKLTNVIFSFLNN